MFVLSFSSKFSMQYFQLSCMMNDLALEDFVYVSLRECMCNYLLFLSCRKPITFQQSPRNFPAIITGLVCTGLYWRLRLSFLCVYCYANMYVYVYVYVFICTYIYMHVYLWGVCVCIYVYVYIYIYIYLGLDFGFRFLT